MDSIGFDSDNHILNCFLTLAKSRFSRLNQSSQATTENQNNLNYDNVMSNDTNFFFHPFLSVFPNFKEEIFYYLISEFINGRLEYFKSLEENQRLYNGFSSASNSVKFIYLNRTQNTSDHKTSQSQSDTTTDDNQQDQASPQSSTTAKKTGKGIQMVQYTTSNGTKILKQKRAKRGQYRKYETDQLNRAMNAVLNGSMSVHKAGSRFGVPHSTLEYKVKEKHGTHHSTSENI